MHGVTRIDRLMESGGLVPYDESLIKHMDPKDVAEMIDQVKTWLGALNGHLKDRTFICGDR